MVLSMFSLTDRVAIVTGSGRGIGKAIALGFAGAGAHVVTVSRTPAEIEATAAQIRAMGRKALAVPTDVCQAQQVENLVKRTVAEFGRIDILVNNAGGVAGLRVPTLELAEAAWDEVIALNMKAAFLCSKAVGKVMVQQKKGNIINVSSGASMLGRPGIAHYGAAKAGLNHLTQTLALEWAPHHIRVNLIIPSSITTPLSKHLYDKQPPEVRQRRIEMIPMGRFGEPEELVGAAIFLASEASSFVTGAAIAVNGGLTI